MPYDYGHTLRRLSFPLHGKTDTVSRVIAAAKKLRHVNQKTVPFLAKAFPAIKSLFVM
jgi:hypothetical protein